MGVINTISAKEYALADIFSKEFDFNIPPYQRPYAWTWENASALFGDVVDFSNEQSQPKNYFLGSLVLIKEGSSQLSIVIDGQQRLTTLTILLSIISWKLKGFSEKKDDQKWQEWADASKNFDEFINEPGNNVKGLVSKPRLTLRPEANNKFFKQYVQDKKFEDLLKLRVGDKHSESQKNIVRNSTGFINKLQSDTDGGLGNDPQRIYDFGRFLVNRCFLVAVTTSDQESAFRIFSVLNVRGLPLELSDILKPEILENILPNQIEDYTKKWEQAEESLGRDSFNELFAHIRMIERKAKAHESVLEELKKTKLLNDSSKFIDDLLVPYAEAFYTIKKSDYDCPQDATKIIINSTIKWLNRIENSDWVPPAILFLKMHDSDDTSVQRFFELLERLAASMYVRGVYRNGRIVRYGDIIEAIETKDIAHLFNGDSPLLLTSEEIKSTLERLDSVLYDEISIRQLSYLLLRLDSFMADPPLDYDKIKRITVEHVLPQTIPDIGEWPGWSKDDIEYWSNRMGNLVLLSNVKNSEAGNKSFEAKQAIFLGEGGRKVACFATTKDVFHKPDGTSLQEWTPQVVENRQKGLIEILKKNWDLH